MSFNMVGTEQSYCPEVIAGSSCIYEFQVGLPEWVNKM